MSQDTTEQHIANMVAYVLADDDNEFTWDDPDAEFSRAYTTHQSVKTGKLDDNRASIEVTLPRGLGETSERYRVTITVERCG